MKKIVSFLILCALGTAMAFSFTACSKKDTRQSGEDFVTSMAETNGQTNANANTLVVYFSVPDDRDNSYVEVNGEQLGNTQYMAQDEIRTDARPEIDGTIKDFDSYDVVFVGYPNWNADMPYIMYSFFETYDFSGKTIVPFMTHGGSGFSGTPETIAELEPNATMLEGKDISRGDIEDAEQEIIDWIDAIGMLKSN